MINKSDSANTDQQVEGSKVIKFRDRYFIVFSEKDKQRLGESFKPEKITSNTRKTKKVECK